MTNERVSPGLGWINIFFGAWLVLSPFVLGFAHNAAWLLNNISVGLAIIVLTFAATKNGLLKALIAIMGPWLFASAFILGGPKPFMWNNLVCAFLVVIVAISSEAPWSRNVSRA